MERPQWMSEQVTEEIEDLQRRFGFEESEALAFWHLRQVWELMNNMRHADVLEELDREEGRGEPQPEEQMVGLINDLSMWHSRVSQHLSALNRELGRRVLRRDYPEGWGRRTETEESEEN